MGSLSVPTAENQDAIVAGVLNDDSRLAVLRQAGTTVESLPADQTDGQMDAGMTPGTDEFESEIGCRYCLKDDLKEGAPNCSTSSISEERIPVVRGVCRWHWF